MADESVAPGHIQPYTFGMTLVGERKALAAAMLALYMLMYLVNSLFGPEELTWLFGALSGLYGLAFFALVAGYFWARWFAIGVGLYGVIGAVMAIVQLGVDFQFLFYGGTHGVVSLFLWGGAMSHHYDGRAEWRERFHLDDLATRRLGKAVIRIGITLPILIIYGLAPRESAFETLLMLSVMGVALLGIRGVLTMRTWGVLLIAASALAILGTVAFTTTFAAVGFGVGLKLQPAGLATALLLTACATPFLVPIASYLRAPKN